MTSTEQLEFSAETQEEVTSLVRGMLSANVIFAEDMNRQVRRIAEHAHVRVEYIFDSLYERLVQRGDVPATEAFKTLEARQRNKQK